jgi:hypothetical protein
MSRQLGLPFARFPGERLDPPPPRRRERRPKGKAVRIGLIFVYPDEPDWREPEPVWIVPGMPQGANSVIN